MNHLAHIFLAGEDADVQLGGLLADFVRGNPDPSWPERVRAGVILHRKIDVYTDAHPEVAALRTLFSPPFRRYAGILLDMYFDHALARMWPAYSGESLDAVSARTLELVATHADWLPPALLRFGHYMRSRQLFGAYADRMAIEHALAGIGRRLQRANPLAEAGTALWPLADRLERGFERFFPDLVGFARERRDGLGVESTS